MKKFFPVLLIVFLAVVNALRFYDLASVPAGYHVDEYSMAVTTRCFGLEGTNAWGKKDGAFFTVAYGSPKPATYVWPGALIGRVFGFRVPVLRAFSAFGAVLGVMGIFFVANLIAGRSAGLWAAASASLAPHIFVMSRVGFEPLYAATFLVWGLFFLLRPGSVKNMILAAVCVSLSAYSYPPARLFLPLFLIAYFFILKGWKSGLKLWCVFIIALLCASLPLIHAIFTDEMVVRRFREISLFSVIKNPLFSTEWFKNFLLGMGHNFKLHLSPEFLFVKGDSSPVHSTTRHGLFSYLDYLAWFFALIMIAAHYIKKEGGHLFDGCGKVIALCLVGFFLAMIPSALTISEIPNALRICLHWPFVSILSGILIAQACRRWSFAGPFVFVAAVIFAVNFLAFYFSDYRRISAGMFNDWVVKDGRAAKTSSDWFQFLVKYRYKDFHTRYFLMNEQQKSCMESFEIWNNVYNNLGRGKRY